MNNFGQTPENNQGYQPENQAAPTSPDFQVNQQPVPPMQSAPIYPTYSVPKPAKKSSGIVGSAIFLVITLLACIYLNAFALIGTPPTIDTSENLAQYEGKYVRLEIHWSPGYYVQYVSNAAYVGTDYVPAEYVVSTEYLVTNLKSAEDTSWSYISLAIEDDLYEDFNTWFDKQDFVDYGMPTESFVVEGVLVALNSDQISDIEYNGIPIDMCQKYSLVANYLTFDNSDSSGFKTTIGWVALGLLAIAIIAVLASVLRMVSGNKKQVAAVNAPYGQASFQGTAPAPTYPSTPNFGTPDPTPPASSPYAEPVPPVNTFTAPTTPADDTQNQQPPTAPSF